MGLTPRTRESVCAVLIGTALVVASSATAVDGVIEINQASALAGGITAGDSPGFPVVISEAGSYRLTSNLTVAGIDTIAIDVTAEDVSLDLGGFRVGGPASCSGPPGAISCTAGAGIGIRSSSSALWVRDGQFAGFATGGVQAGAESRLDHVTARDNGGDGLSTGSLSSVTHCTAIGNSGHGVAVGADSVVLACNASANNSFGLSLGIGSGFSSCVLNQNGTGAFSGGVPGEGNVCDGIGICVGCSSPVQCPPTPECQLATCVSGLCGLADEPIDAACTLGGSFCDGFGSCVECNSPGQCPSAPLCQAPTCTGSQCGIDNAPAGTPAPPGQQTAGDCQEVQCDGAGGLTSAPDNTDFPNDDGLECTDDLCVAGTPSHPPVPELSSCSTGICCGGLCLGGPICP